jgi:transcriptional regulator with XRE-family HTH domain
MEEIVRNEIYDINKLTASDVGRLMTANRNRLGISQGEIAKELGYANANFISMTETGKSKIPVNKIDAFVEAYRMSPEFSLVILKVMYPDMLETILTLAKKVPRIFKGFIKSADAEIEEVYATTTQSVKRQL